MRCLKTIFFLLLISYIRLNAQKTDTIDNKVAPESTIPARQTPPTSAVRHSFLDQPMPDGAMSMLTVNIITPGITYEQRIAKKQTLAFEAGLGFYLHVSIETVSSYYGSSTTTEVAGRVFPYFTLDYKGYYNYNNRIRKHKNVSYNAMNYVGFHTYTALVDLFNNGSTSPQILFGPVWGIQRTANGLVNFEFRVGPGIVINSSGVNFSPILGIRLGFTVYPHSKSHASRSISSGPAPAAPAHQY